MTDQKNALLGEIRADPEDMTSRLVYADWLEENGDPLSELIRIQCELAELPADSPQRAALATRERDLLADYHENRVQPLKDRFGAIGVVVKGGFVESLRISADTFLDHAAEIVEVLPALCSLTLGRPRKRIRELASTPALQQVPGLDLREAGLGDEGLAVLLDSPYLGRLVRLNLSGNQLTADSAAAIANSEKLSELRGLDVSNNPLGRGLGVLGQSAILNQVRELTARKCQLSLADVAAFGETEGLPLLEHLTVAQNDLQVNTQADLQFHRPLKTLRLWGTGIPGDALSSLLLSPALGVLETLDISDNALGPDSIAGCLCTDLLPELRRFIAMRNVAGADSHRKFFDFPQRIPIGNAPLESLNLAMNQLSDQCFQRLAESGCLRQATTLTFNQTGIDIPGLRAVLKATTRLSRLSVRILESHPRRRNHPLGRMLRELASWPGLPGLRYLELTDSLLSDSDGFGQLLNSLPRHPTIRIVSKYDYYGDRLRIRKQLEKRYGSAANIVAWS